MRSMSAFLSLLLLAGAVPAQQVATVVARVETTPVPDDGDAADDIAIWVHPTRPELSLILGTDKRGGLAVYGLGGNQRQFLADGRLNNVDLRYDFSLGGRKVALATAGRRGRNVLKVYAIEPNTRAVVDVTARDIPLNTDVYGSCMYRSPLTGEFYFFCTTENGGLVQQWRLFDTGNGVDAELVRTFDIGSQSEGCVADDAHRWLFIAQENVGIWRYGAEPGAGDGRVLVDSQANGHLDGDIEGLALYHAAGGAGYLIASSQGNDRFVVYDRQAPYAYRMTFAIGANAALGIDGVGDTDGIEVANVWLGEGFPGGVFVAQDGTNPGANQNFKLVDWRDIANAASPPLLVEPFHDEQGVRCPVATGELRFGTGVNPFSLTASGVPRIGSPWSATLHCDDVSPGLAFLFFFAEPASGRFVPAGELLVDLRSLRLLTLARPHSGDARTFHLPVPPDLLLCGLTATCQGLCIGTGEAQLSNAIDVRFGR